MTVPLSDPDTADRTGSAPAHAADTDTADTGAAALLTALRRDLPDDALGTGPEATGPYATDRSGSQPDGVPFAVVHATHTEHVQTALRHAHDLRIPVVPRGAGTGLSGGASAGAGSVVLDLSHMNRILELSPEEQIAVVEPGVITAELDRAAGEFGLRYAPDPASAAISTVGGNIATNAGGLRCAKYGVTRDALLGLDAVLADGTLVRTGRRTVKGVTGYDLTGLLTGSEGTLGVITSATLRLRPVPEETVTVAAHFATFAEGAEPSPRSPPPVSSPPWPSCSTARSWPPWTTPRARPCGRAGAPCCSSSAMGGARPPKPTRPYGACADTRRRSRSPGTRPRRIGCSPRGDSPCPRWSGWAGS